VAAYAYFDGGSGGNSHYLNLPIIAGKKDTKLLVPEYFSHPSLLLPIDQSYWDSPSPAISDLVYGIPSTTPGFRE